MSADDGGSAFPSHGSMGEVAQEGMTLRDYFAAKAMAALMPIYWETQDEYASGEDLMQCQVRAAYEYADAMLKERAR